MMNDARVTHVLNVYSQYSLVANVSGGVHLAWVLHGDTTEQPSDFFLLTIHPFDLKAPKRNPPHFQKIIQIIQIIELFNLILEACHRQVDKSDK